MDVSSNAAPPMNSTAHSVLYSYLCDVSNESTVATSILQVLFDERRTSHRTRWNENRAAKMLEVGDVVKFHVQV